jgi:hypothetical protein
MPNFSESAHDLMQMSLGEIGAGEEVRVTVKMVRLVEIEDEYFKLIMPISYFSRIDAIEEPQGVKY